MRKLAAGNWKMNGTASALAEVDALLSAFPDPGCEMLLCPPATLIARMADRVNGRPLLVGGQDCHFKTSGAHTGDVSAAMLKDAGATHVILGHSERRADHGESDALICSKTQAAIAEGLIAIVCVGETEAERDAGQAESVVLGQLQGSLPDDANGSWLSVAYEPVWAIGTGRIPSIDDVTAMHDAIRNALVARFGEGGAAIRILYGGSMNGDNAAVLLTVANVDGGLIGGASLSAEKFLPIVEAAAAA